MPTTLWLIRHGETDWNRSGLYQGQADIPLNGTGLAQARATADKLASSGNRFTVIFSSPLKRARQTAEETAHRLGAAVQEDRRLMEIDQGAWTGKDYRMLTAQFGTPSKGDGARHSLDERAPGGESVAEVAGRMRAAADEISARYPGQDVLVFTHGLALATLRCQVEGIPLEEVYQHIPDNGEIIVIQWG